MINPEDEDRLKNIDVKDSKELTSRQRECLFDKIKDIIEEDMIIVIEPLEIDEAVNSETINLNWLEALKTVEIINTLKPDIAYIDCPSNNIKAYKDYLSERITNKKIKLVVEHKADQKYAVVSAASILAKVTRDEEIKKIQSKIKESIGSGYPSDPTTQKFLINNFKKYPEIFRHSWQTYKNIAGGKKQKKLGEF